MTIRFIEDAEILFKNDNKTLDFGRCKSLSINLQTKFSGILDRESNTVTTTVLGDKTLPIKIVFTSEFNTSNDEKISLIDELHKMAHADRKAQSPLSKGKIEILDKTNNEKRIFQDACLVSDPEYLGRTIASGNKSSDYRIVFLCADEEIGSEQ